MRPGKWAWAQRGHSVGKALTHIDRTHKGRKGHKNQFWVYVQVYQQLTHLSRTDAAVGKPKIITVQIFSAAWAERRSLCI